MSTNIARRPAPGTTLLYQNRVSPTDPGAYPDAIVQVVPSPFTGMENEVWVERVGTSWGTGSPGPFMTFLDELTEIPENIMPIIGHELPAAEWIYPHVPVRSAITKAVVCRVCHAVLTTEAAQNAPCPAA